jgi:hypothetical protein
LTLASPMVWSIATSKSIALPSVASISDLIAGRAGRLQCRFARLPASFRNRVRANRNLLKRFNVIWVVQSLG